MRPPATKAADGRDGGAALSRPLSPLPRPAARAVCVPAAAALVCALAAPAAGGDADPGRLAAGTSLRAPLTGTPGNAAQGAQVMSGRRLGNCLACHAVSRLRSEEFHGDLGPPLDGVAGRWDAAALRMIVVDPKRVFGDATVMPAFYRTAGLSRVRPEFAGKPILTAQQVEDVVAFLTTLK